MVSRRIGLVEGEVRGPGIPRAAARIVPRTRLLDLLERVFDSGVVLISAPAGFGKTVLLSSWAAQLDGVRVAWISCDDRHNDRRVLVNDIAVALAVPDGRGRPIEYAVKEAGRTNDRVLIVLDDVHRLVADPAVSTLGALLDARPHNVFVAVSGREELALPWHRHRVAGEVVGVHARDLAFTNAEAGDLLRRVFSLDLPRQDVQGLRRSTEGWATGLCLAGHTLTDAARRAEPVPDIGQDRYLRQFMESELIAGLSPDQVQFLEVTSCLDRLDPELCNILTGHEDALQLLERFVEMNLFTEEISTVPPVYRYHTLFAGWLRTRVERSRDIDVTKVLDVASRWYESHGLIDSSIDTALRAEDFPRAERLIRDASGATLRAGRVVTLTRWLAMLPVEILEGKPDLALLLARAAGSSGDIATARSGLMVMGHVLPQEPAAPVQMARDQLDLLIRLLDGDLAGVPDGFEELSKVVRSHPQENEYATHALDADILAAHRAAALMFMGELGAAIATTEEILTPGGLAHPTMATILALGVQTLSQSWRGDCAEAQASTEAFRDKVARFQGSTGDPLPFLMASVWCGELDRAEEDLEAIASIAMALHWPIYRALNALARARHAVRVGERDRCHAALAEAGDIIRPMRGGQFLASLAEQLREDANAALGGEGASVNSQERSVLRELATGASRREVGERLYLSINTVKTHLRTAYRKLGVDNREDAIKRARILGLLGDSDQWQKDVEPPG